MTNLEKYTKCFTESFNITDDKVADLVYQSIQEWDSVGHMQLITAFEETFDIMLDTDDIIDLNSFAVGKEILKKYDVEFM